MLAILLALSATTSIHLQKAATMMVDSNLCHIEYYNEDLRDELIKGGLDTGVSATESAHSAANMAAALLMRIQSSVGAANYCLTRGQ